MNDDKRKEVTKRLCNYLCAKGLGSISVIVEDLVDGLPLSANAELNWLIAEDDDYDED